MAQVNYFGANDLGTECCSDKRIKECFHSCCESAVQSLVVEVPCQNNSPEHNHTRVVSAVHVALRSQPPFRKHLNLQHSAQFDDLPYELSVQFRITDILNQ